MNDFDDVYLVVDALDECYKEIDQEDWEDMLEWLGDLPSSRVRNLHTLVTSRKERELENLFLPPLQSSRRWPVLSVTKHSNSEDIRTYVTRQVQNDWKLNRLENSMKEDIRDTLTNGADGM